MQALKPLPYSPAFADEAVALSYPNECGLCGLRLVDVDTPNCAQLNCPIRANVAELVE